MFVGEAPGRLGADRTAVPFHGDKAGDNFEALLALANLRRREVFVTNAVLCNPRDEEGNNAPPSRSALKNCSENLQSQIEVVNPQLVITLGAAALESTRLVEHHALTLASNVRSAHAWNGRTLIPLYHPGARAMIHRNFSLQTADYYFVGEQYRRLDRPRRKQSHQARPESSAWEIVRHVIARLGQCSLFRLHKAMYLIDYRSVQQRGFPVTDFFYIRQKEGPYCVELGSRWFKAFESEVGVKTRDGRAWLTWKSEGLFSYLPPIAASDAEIIDAVLAGIEVSSDSQLKTKAYLTQPMRESLRAEREGHSQLNKPLL